MGGLLAGVGCSTRVAPSAATTVVVSSLSHGLPARPGRHSHTTDDARALPAVVEVLFVPDLDDPEHAAVASATAHATAIAQRPRTELVVLTTDVVDTSEIRE